MTCGDHARLYSTTWYPCLLHLRHSNKPASMVIKLCIHKEEQSNIRCFTKLSEYWPNWVSTGAVVVQHLTLGNECKWIKVEWLQYWFDGAVKIESCYIDSNKHLLIQHPHLILKLLCYWWRRPSSTVLVHINIPLVLPSLCIQCLNTVLTTECTDLWFAPKLLTWWLSFCQALGGHAHDTSKLHTTALNNPQFLSLEYPQTSVSLLTDW